MALEFAEFSVHERDFFDVEGVSSASAGVDNVDSITN